MVDRILLLKKEHPKWKMLCFPSDRIELLTDETSREDHGKTISRAGPPIFQYEPHWTTTEHPPKRLLHLRQAVKGDWIQPRKTSSKATKREDRICSTPTPLPTDVLYKEVQVKLRDATASAGSSNQQVNLLYLQLPLPPDLTIQLQLL